MIRVSFWLPALLLVSSCSGIPPTSEYAVTNSTTITLERTVCFGWCPAYTITLAGSGEGIFIGTNFVAVKDTVQFAISRADMKKLLEEFQKIKFLDFDSQDPSLTRCATVATDHPSVIISLRSSGRVETVNYYYGCYGEDGPPEGYKPVDRIGTMIDSLTMSDRWIKTKDGKRALN